MLEVAGMGLHVAQMTSQAGMRQCFDAVTTHNARILGLDGYGVEPGCRGDFVLLQARSPADAIRLRAQRLLVVRGGRVLAQAPVRESRLHLQGRPATVDLSLQR
jgi:cytosine deaminase